MAEKDERKRRITLHLYDTDLVVNILAKEEELYREGEKLITSIVNSYMTRFKGAKTDKEILYMALIDMAFRYVKEATRRDVSPYRDILSRFTSEIEEVLR